MAERTDRLGDLLVAQGVLDTRQLAEALAHQKAKRVPLGEALRELGLASEDVVGRALARQAGLPFVDLTADVARGGRVAEGVLAAVPAEVAAEHRVVPVALKGDRLLLAVDDPVRTYELDTLQFVLDRDVAAALTTPSGLAAALDHYYGVGGAGPDTDLAEALGEETAEGEDDAPIIRLVRHLLTRAVEEQASDVHVEPLAGRIRVRFRRDGVLSDVASHELELLGPLLSRLKLMAGMDIAERRKPQDGRINLSVGGRSIDIRASVLPSNHGEAMVLRLLDKERGLVSLGELGFGEDDQRRFERVIARPNGIVLVTGPTGSGKTTTLYAALKELNRPDVKILTAEDPVEYEIPGINQVQVHPRIGLTFAKILRSMLRQAPNVILVGEIRDAETAEVAIQAALTGHLVFATLHTNDAPSALARLHDMGIQPFLVSASIQAVMAQRLVRKLCPECREVHAPSESELRAVGLDAERIDGRTLYRARGCSPCHFTGYRGRVAVFELLVMDGTLREMAFRGEPTPAVRAQAQGSGRMRALHEDALDKLLAGVTSLEEVLRVSQAP